MIQEIMDYSKNKYYIHRRTANDEHVIYLITKKQFYIMKIFWFWKFEIDRSYPNTLIEKE